MPRYRVENRITKEVAEVEAPFAQEACMDDWELLCGSAERRALHRHHAETYNSEKELKNLKEVRRDEGKVFRQIT